jgi:hypothetical protein
MQQNTKYSRQQEVDNLNVQLEGLNSSISAIEDFVFRDFCKRLGIPNIRYRRCIEYVRISYLQDFYTLS